MGKILVMSCQGCGIVQRVEKGVLTNCNSCDWQFFIQKTEVKNKMVKEAIKTEEEKETIVKKLSEDAIKTIEEDAKKARAENLLKPVALDPKEATVPVSEVPIEVISARDIQALKDRIVKLERDNRQLANNFVTLRNAIKRALQSVK